MCEGLSAVPHMGASFSSGDVSPREEEEIEDQLGPANSLEMTVSKSNTVDACGGCIDPDNTQVESFR